MDSVVFQMSNPGPPKLLWRDHQVRTSEAVAQNTLGIHNVGKRLCLQTTIQLLDTMEEVQILVPEIRVPVCAIHGTSDFVSHSKNSRFVTSRVETDVKDVELHMIKGGNHDLLADPEAEEVMENMDSFIRSQTLKSTAHLLIHQESRMSFP